MMNHGFCDFVVKRARSMRRSAACLAITITVTITVASFCQAGDWPQILGPARNGIGEGEKLANSWGEDGPKRLWQRSVGSGFSSIAIAENKAILFHRIEGKQWVEAMDARSGKVLWKKSYPTRYQKSIVQDDGPRCTPVIHQDKVYLFGAGGELFCLSMKDGQEVWFRNLRREFKTPTGYFGVGSTPIIEGDSLLVNVGSRDGAGLAAFGLADGKTIWQSTDEVGSYSSPVATTVDGVRHVIFLTRMNVVSVDPKTGKTRFRFPFGARGPTVNGASPVVVDGHVFVTASYGLGAVFAKIGKQSSQIVWRDKKIMASQYATSIHSGGYLYGVNGRADGGSPDLRCVGAKTGKLIWSKTAFGMGTPIMADGKILIAKEDGTLVMIKPSAKGYRQLASAKLMEGTTRALPSLSNGRLFLRDDQTLRCFDVGRK